MTPCEVVGPAHRSRQVNGRICASEERAEMAMLHFKAQAAGVCALLLAVLSGCAESQNRRVEAAESAYADFLDAAGALDTIDSGLVDRFDAADRATWASRYQASVSKLRSSLAAIQERALFASNRRALYSMRAGVDYRESSSLAPAGECAGAERQGATGAELRAALYACFSQLGDAIQFEGRSYARTAALQLLERLDEPARRRGLFFAMAPLWLAVNGNDEPQSPYRRLIKAERRRMQDNIARAEAALGLEAGASEAWIISALEAWRDHSPDTLSEPWDFRYVYAAGTRAVDHCAPIEAVREANDRYFADLGADLDRLGVIQDVGSRPGMAPVDYADFARVGRVVGHAWRPAVPRISVRLLEGGLGSSAELAHEAGHAAHYAAMRARPSMLLPDDFTLAVEAFADLTAWSVYTPAWQRKYLGCASTAVEGMRARLGAVALDLAWGLFEFRMSRDPNADPNAVWTGITREYLHIKPHPELSWWAVRGQLADDPGYMIHYALGAFVTADVRARIASAIGSFDSGNPRWYGFVSERLYGHGAEIESAPLLRAFLGRPVSPSALLDDLATMGAQPAPPPGWVVHP
jgi:hypothetical protein